MPARAHLLEVIADLYTGLESVKVEAAEEGDTWAGVAASWVQQAVFDAAERAEQERRIRGES